MNLFRVFFLVNALAAFAFGATSTMDNFLFNGRWSHAEGVSRASAPAASITFNAKTSAITATIEGHSRWRLDRDGKQIDQFEVGSKEAHVTKVEDDGEFHKYRLIKISESGSPEIKFYGISLEGEFGETPKHSSRRIEFIGDSFTVGFGCEGASADDPSLEFEKTNASRSYAYLLANGFGADYQVNAFSGRGLVRNYDNIVPKWTLEKLYDYTVMGSVTEYAKPERWNFDSFHPQVIVLFIGINDFQGNPPYADKGKFKKAYAGLLAKLRKAHPGVKFLLVSTKIWPNDDLGSTVKAVYDAEIAAGHIDLEYKHVLTSNVGLLGHPDIHSQEELATTLRPIIARLGRWLSR